MRVGALYGGLERYVDTALSPSQKIFVAVSEATISPDPNLDQGYESASSVVDHE